MDEQTGVFIVDELGFVNNGVRLVGVGQLRPAQRR
jgi:hypothetical protein